MKNPVWTVKEVEAKNDYTLLITENREKKLYNALPLKNIGFFMSAKAECGTVVWNDDVDIAPEHLYEMSVSV